MQPKVVQAGWVRRGEKSEGSWVLPARGRTASESTPETGHPGWASLLSESLHHDLRWGGNEAGVGRGRPRILPAPRSEPGSPQASQCPVTSLLPGSPGSPTSMSVVPWITLTALETARKTLRCSRRVILPVSVLPTAVLGGGAGGEGDRVVCGGGHTEGKQGEEADPSRTPRVVAPSPVWPRTLRSRIEAWVQASGPKGSGEAAVGKVMCWLEHRTQPLGIAWAESWW